MINEPRSASGYQKSVALEVSMIVRSTKRSNGKLGHRYKVFSDGVTKHLEFHSVFEGYDRQAALEELELQLLSYHQLCDKP